MSRHSSPQPAHRKTLPIKRNDAEPITRSDLQYDLLHYIFSDTHTVFTDSHHTLRGDPPGTKVTFHDLYVNALVKSPRASKVLREKMLDTPEFGTDFAKLALLANVGRINTTMACEFLRSLFLPAGHNRFRSR
jgi:Ino eighty subunit 1